LDWIGLVEDLPQEALEDDYRSLRPAFSEVAEMIDYRCRGRFPDFIEVVEDNRTKKVSLLKVWRDT
jgi:hypothetical protein